LENQNLTDEFEDYVEHFFDGGDDDDGHHGDDDDGDHGGDDDCGDDNDDAFYHDHLQDLFGQFTLNLDTIDFKQLGKMLDWQVTADGFSVSFGKGYSLDIEAHDITFKMGKGHVPVITGGTIDSFSFESPGLADFSISGLDMSAKQFAQALTHLNTGQLMHLLLGGNETISGTGYDDFLLGGKGNDTILGNEGNDRIFGMAGKDNIDGGTGNDLLMGGHGRDTFVFAPGTGQDVIGDFSKGDRIDLTAWGFSSWEEFSSQYLETENDDDDHGHDCGRHFGGDDDRGGRGHEREHEDHGRGGSITIELADDTSITLRNVDWSDLGQDNFLL